MRDAKDAPKVKDYILPLVFAKRLCDVYDDEINRIAQEVGGRVTYPVVRDLTMYVKRSTGFADGLAWVRSTADFAYTLGDINLGSHLPQYNTRTRGYVQFNSLPALLSNAPVQVISASLDVEPQPPRRGSSSAAGAVSAVDQEEIVAASLSQIVEQIGRWTNGAPI